VHLSIGDGPVQGVEDYGSFVPAAKDEMDGLTVYVANHLALELMRMLAAGNGVTTLP
jgi:hypothetical protein